MQLIYPVPSASGVPDDASTFVYGVAAATAIPISLAIGTASPAPLEPASVPSPGPTPSASPATNETYFAVSLPALQAATAYTLDASVPVEAGCANFTKVESLSSFTTR